MKSPLGNSRGTNSRAEARRRRCPPVGGVVRSAAASHPTDNQPADQRSHQELRLCAAQDDPCGPSPLRPRQGGAVEVVSQGRYPRGTPPHRHGWRYGGDNLTAEQRQAPGVSALSYPTLRSPRTPTTVARVSMKLTDRKYACHCARGLVPGIPSGVLRAVSGMRSLPTS